MCIRDRYADTVLTTERNYSSSLRTLLDTAIREKKPAPWYNHPAFWFSVGFIVAGATTVGITYAVNSK